MKHAWFHVREKWGLIFAHRVGRTVPMVNIFMYNKMIVEKKMTIKNKAFT